MKEEWKDIKGFEGWYQVSNEGKVFSVKSNILLNPYIVNNGYCIVTLCKDKRKYRRSVHRLVAQSFMPNPENKPEINHKDGDKTNNCVKNLEWVTREENEKHAWANGLKRLVGCKKVLDKDTGFVYPSVGEAARQTGKFAISISRSCRCAKKSRWSFV